MGVDSGLHGCAEFYVAAQSLPASNESESMIHILIQQGKVTDNLGILNITKHFFF